MVSSILTNLSSMTALTYLSSTQQQMSNLEEELNTGERISSAADGAAAWSQATSMESEVDSLGAVSNGLSLSKGILTTTTSAMSQIVTLLQGMKADTVAAQQSGADLSALGDDISEKQKEIEQMAQDATYAGVNWLDQQENESESITENSQWNGTTFEGETGTITYSLTDQNGNVSAATQNFSVAADGTATYAPLSGGSSPLIQAELVTGYNPESGVSTAPVELGDISILQNTQVGGVAQVTDNETNTATGVTTTVTSRQTATGGPADFLPNANAFSADTALDPFYVPAALDGSGQYVPAGGTGIAAIDYGPDPDPAGAPILISPYTGVLDYNVDPSKFIFNPLNPVTLTANDFSEFNTMLNGAIDQVESGASVLGGLENNIAQQQNYLSNLSDSLTASVGSLVDADMNEVSTRIAALQVQQQLGVQALSIANGNASIILKLFQGV